MQRLIEIPASDIEAAGLAVEMALPAEWLTEQLADAEARAIADGRVTARLSRSGRADIVVRGTVHAELEVPCARCLKPAAVTADGELALLLEPRPGAADVAARGPRARATPEAAAKARAVDVIAPTLGGVPRGAGHSRAAVERAPAGTRDERRAPKGGKGKSKVPRIAEYEFNSEEADHDEYDGETVILDPFVREAILLELPNFPLCSETCAGISPPLRPAGHVTKAWGRSPRIGRSRGSSPGESPPPQALKNPFEALKHLAHELPPGPEPSPEALSAGPSESPVPIPQPHPSQTHSPQSDLRPHSNQTTPARLVTSHAAPGRKADAKKLSHRAKANRKGPLRNKR